MLRLVFTVCMLNSPEVCEQRELLIHDDIPAAVCLMGAMPELALWRETHPNWSVTRWRCEDSRLAEKGMSSTMRRGLIP